MRGLVRRSLNEPVTTSRQSFTPVSINEPPALPDVDAPAPTITSIAPTEAAIGADSFDLVVTGENFFVGTVINFAGYDEPTTHDGDTVSTLVNMDYWHGPDAIIVYVHNGEKVSNEATFTFLPPVEVKTRARDEEAEVDAADPDALEDEIEQAEEEGDFKSVHASRTTVVVKKKTKR